MHIDHRIIAETTSSYIERYGEVKENFLIIDTNEDEDLRELLEDLFNEIPDELEIPLTKIICPTCEGRGSYVNPSIDSNGLTREDFDEDPFFEEDYLSGIYDVVCKECRGHGLSFEISPNTTYSDIINKTIEYINKYDIDSYYYALEVAAERRMGC